MFNMLALHGTVPLDFGKGVIPLTYRKEFLLFYMCQLWALHVVINDRFLHLYLQFFY